MIKNGPEDRGESVLTDVDLSENHGDWVVKRPRFPITPAAEAGFSLYMEEADKDDVLGKAIPETHMRRDAEGVYFIQRRIIVDPRYANMEIPDRPGMFDPEQADLEQIAEIVDIINSNASVYVKTFGRWAVGIEAEHTDNTGLTAELNPDGFLLDTNGLLHMVDVNPILYQGVDAVRDMLASRYSVLSAVTDVAIKNSGLKGELRKIDPKPEEAHRALPIFELAA